MGFPKVITISSDAIFDYYTSNQSKKKIQLTASTLLDNVAVYAVKTNNTKVQFINLAGKNKKRTFKDNLGTTQITTLLAPKIYKNPIGANRSIITIGEGDSNDPHDRYEAAQVNLTWSADPPARSTVSSFPGSTTSFNSSQIPGKYYLYLNKPKNTRYCAIDIQAFANGNTAFGALEMDVEIHVINANDGALISVIYDTQKSGNDQGAVYTDISNNSFYLDMNDYPKGFYLLPMIKSTSESNSQVSFTIGDPKTDATVSIMEI